MVVGSIILPNRAKTRSKIGIVDKIKENAIPPPDKNI